MSYHADHDTETGKLLGVQFYGEKPLYDLAGQVVAVHDVWFSNGISFAAVTAAEPIFITEGRYPGRPTAHSVVKVSDLVPFVVEGSPLADATENWIAAMNDADAFEEVEDKPNYFAAEELAQEAGLFVQQMVADALSFS